MRDFDKYMSERQVEWRGHHIETIEQGSQNGVRRPWILPASLWELALWDEVRAPLSEYLPKNGVTRHAGSHNLKSSWVSGVNTYFPFGQTDGGRALLAAFLRAKVHGGIRTVDSVELEYAETGELSPAQLLGEDGGSRGSGQTSPDIAVLVNGRTGLLLVENKLTEHSFYPCSARRSVGSASRPANPDRSRCLDAGAVSADPTLCHQHAWGRKYWERLGDAVDSERLAGLRCCPGATAGYQLLRQQALAEGIAASGEYEFVVSCVALDARNDTLRHSLRRTGLNDVSDWGGLFPGRASFCVFTHQDWIAWVKARDEGSEWTSWCAWIEERYGF